LASKRKGASVILVNPKGQVLLYLRDDKREIPYANCWDLLGGNVEVGESAEECIKRELLEEIELDLRKPQLFHVHDMDDRIEHTFWAEHDLDIASTRLHEGQRLQWFSGCEILEIPDDQLAFGFKSILLDFFRERPWIKDV
jgi:8-oxo-dGTP diphosphatase